MLRAILILCSTFVSIESTGRLTPRWRVRASRLRTHETDRVAVAPTPTAGLTACGPPQGLLLDALADQVELGSPL
jgi:hypothetical protein